MGRLSHPKSGHAGAPRPGRDRERGGRENHSLHGEAEQHMRRAGGRRGRCGGEAGLRGAHGSRVGREEAGKKKMKWKKDERHRRLRNEEIRRTKKVWEHRLRRAGKLRQEAGEGGEKVREDP